jgi:osmotically-inducible protein OsmY
MSEQQNPKTEKEAGISEERGLGGMGSDGDSSIPHEDDQTTEKRRSIDFLRASDVMGAKGWEGDEPRLNQSDEKSGHQWGLKGNAGLGPKGYRRSDESIEEDVCERLTQDPVIDASDVEVQVHDGEVTLTGTVSGRIEKRRAEDIIAEIRGVKNIQNRITVEGSSQTSRDDDSSRSNAGAT